MLLSVAYKPTDEITKAIAKTNHFLALTFVPPDLLGQHSIALNLSISLKIRQLCGEHKSPFSDIQISCHNGKIHVREEGHSDFRTSVNSVT